MPANPAILEDQVMRFGAALTGLVLLVSARLAWGFARDHMAAVGTICGAGSDPHCGWCYAAASLVLAGLAAMAYAARPRRRALRA